MANLPLVEPDDDLIPLLRDASNELLDPLVGYLVTTGKEGTTRLTSELGALDVYKLNTPNHHRYYEDIAAELQMYGANTLATVFVRGGKGVPYREIVRDVAKKLKVNVSDNMDVATIELQILLKVLGDAWDKMDEAQKKDLLERLGSKQASLPKALPIAAIQIAIRSSGFIAYQIAAIVANAVARQILGKGLTLVANQGLMKGLAIFAGPIGLVITALWTLIDIAGPAYRVTIPSVIQVAMIRQQSLMTVCTNGHPNAKTAAFCSECGAKVGGES